MKINLSQYPKAASSFLFVFILLFSGMVQAGLAQKISSRYYLQNTPHSKIRKVIDTLENHALFTGLDDVSAEILEELVRAWDDPVRLVEPSDRTAMSAIFKNHSIPETIFFFSRFDLQKHGDALFTKLFTEQTSGVWRELPFQEAKRNWDNFNHGRENLSQIYGVDVQAAAISFIHRNFSDRYFPNANLASEASASTDYTQAYYNALLPYPNSSIRLPITAPSEQIRHWPPESLGAFFHDRFTIGHYMSPHFTLTPENPYYQFTIDMVSFFLKQETLHSPSAINSKDFILKVWKDVTIDSQETIFSIRPAFLKRIVNSIIEFRTSGSGDFMKAMEEAARENDRLAEFMGVVYKLANGTNAENQQFLLENQRVFNQRLREQTPTSEVDQVINDLLSRSDLENLIFPPRQVGEETTTATRILEMQQRESIGNPVVDNLLSNARVCCKNRDKRFLMIINRSQYTRVISGFFFVFILLFSGMAQAVSFHRMIPGLSDIPYSKIQEVFGTLKNQGINKPENMPQETLRQLVRALDDPIRLIDNSPSYPTGLFRENFDIKSRFLFARFDLYRHSDALFTKLFSKKSGSELEQLPLEEAKRNWGKFYDEAEVANRFGYSQIKGVDLEASAISFVHQRFSGTYFPNADLYLQSPISRPWEGRSLSTFLRDKLTIAHYMSPHFTLTPEAPYHSSIMRKISLLLEERTPSSSSMINSKEFVLRIWNDVTQEIRISSQASPGISSDVFLKHIVDSIIEFKNSPIYSVKPHPFLEAMEAAARENDDLAQLVGIVKKFASSNNLENYRQSLLEQFNETPGSEIDQMIHEFLLRCDPRRFRLATP